MEGDKKNFLLGLFIGIAVISLIAFFTLLFFYAKGDKTGGSKVTGNTNQPAVVQPQPEEETGDPSKLSAVTNDDHIRGDFNAPVTLILFDDFECPYCLKFEPTLKQVLAEYQGKVRVVFRHFPLPFHPNAQKAAEASECAGEQGKFWEMHDKIFEANEKGTMGIETWKKEAKNLSLDTQGFNDCLDSGKYASKISANLSEGQAAGVQGTPASFINGELVSGALPYEDFTGSKGQKMEGIKSIIDSKLK